MRRLGRTVSDAVPFAITPAILAISVACVVIWFVEVATWSAWWDSYLALSVHGIARGRVWELLTFQFLHDPRGVFHVLFNVMALVFFGRQLEQRWGSARFVRFFLTCGVGGGLLYVGIAALLRTSAPLVGASAGIMGVLMACALIWPHQQVIVMFVLPMTMRQLVFLYALLDLMLSWLGAMGGSAWGTVAHVGGLLTGWIYVAHAWRLRRFATMGSPLASLGRWWRRRRMRVVDRDFDKWLELNDKDESKH